MEVNTPFFFDWLTAYQDFEQRLPVLGDQLHVVVDALTGAVLHESSPSFRHEGSFSTSIQIRVTPFRITVSGNPSRLDRIDNLFGFTSLDDCFRVYNRVLLSLGLPPFTKCTRTFFRQGEDGKKVQLLSDGAVIREVHCTTNRAVGEGCVVDYLKALSTQHFRNSLPHLHSNGRTVDWRSKKGHARLLYTCVYDKAFEMLLHHQDKILREFGRDSEEFRYFRQVVEFCESQGIARFENKIKSELLRRGGCCFWGLFDESLFAQWQEQLLAIDERLQVVDMKYETIAEKLLRVGVCTSTLAANTTAMYALSWMSGRSFDLDKSAVKIHRARLRQIGIDIADPCDLTRHAPIQIRRAKEIVTSDYIAAPSWYRFPTAAPVLRSVA